MYFIECHKISPDLNYVDKKLAFLSTILYLCDNKILIIMATITLNLSLKVDEISKKSEIMIRFVGSRKHVFRCKSGLCVCVDVRLKMLGGEGVERGSG